MNTPRVPPIMVPVLKDWVINTWFWNYSCGIVLILGRFVPIVGQVAIAGILAKKNLFPKAPAHCKPIQ